VSIFDSVCLFHSRRHLHFNLQRCEFGLCVRSVTVSSCRSRRAATLSEPQSLTRRGFTRVHQTFRNAGTLCGVHVTTEREAKMCWTRKLVQLVEPDLRANTRRTARRLDIWRTLHAEGRVKHLGLGDFVKGLEFCIWLSGSRSLHCYILYIDEVQFHTDGISNKQSWCLVTQVTFRYVSLSLCGV